MAMAYGSIQTPYVFEEARFDLYPERSPKHRMKVFMVGQY